MVFHTRGFGGCTRAHPPCVAPEALEEWIYSSRGFFPIEEFYRVCQAHECEPGSLGLGLVAGRAPEPPHGARGRSGVSLSFLCDPRTSFSLGRRGCLSSPRVRAWVACLRPGCRKSPRASARSERVVRGSHGFLCHLAHPFRSDGGVVRRAPSSATLGRWVSTKL